MLARLPRGGPRPTPRAARWTRRASCSTGSFCEQPPLGLIKTLERSGCYIVDDDFVQVHRWIQGDVADRRAIRSTASSTAFLTDAIAQPDALLRGRDEGPGPGRPRRAARARTASSSARRRFCDPALLDQPMAITRLERRGIPWTAFKYSENTGQFQVIREQAGTFADSIKLWSAA